jgi:hypothetical protein
MSDTVRLYAGKDIDVTYDVERCIGECNCRGHCPMPERSLAFYQGAMAAKLKPDPTTIRSQ